ncbi:MAG: T9SS type A sorting domain-containing protein [Bacteroidales bacterium]|nr:T9SS type A sorting domain-containing protein [Bacteroidales bacterium]
MKKLNLLFLLLLCVINVSAQELRHYVEYSSDNYDASIYEMRYAQLKEYIDSRNISNTEIKSRAAADDYAGGDGTSENPYQIATPEQLVLLAQQTNNGTGGDACYILTNDIDLEGNIGFLWTPIGKDPYYFTGVFDGNNHTIKNMHSSDELKSGFFGGTKGAVIKNINFTDAQISASPDISDITNAMAGTVAAHAINTSIYNCDVEGKVSTTAWYCGGIIGSSLATTDFHDLVLIKDCINRADVAGMLNNGGIVGFSEGSVYNFIIENCENHGNIDGDFIGGIMGDGEGFMIINCRNYGQVGIKGSFPSTTAGGMIGQGGVNIIIEDCINIGAITAGNAGGMTGAALKTVIRRCGNRGKITGYHFSTILAGGICGSDGKISDSYNTGKIVVEINNYDHNYNVSTIQIGGITGSPTSGCIIHNVYNAGNISKWPTPQNSEFYTHILPALLEDTEISNCYWFGNDEIDDKIYDFGVQAYAEIPESSRFNEGSTATSWILENPQYNTADLLEALNAGAMNGSVWIEDTENLNGGFPILKPIPVDTTTVREYAENEVDMISVYPNPAKDIVKLSAANHHLSAVRIYNCLGMMVEEMNVRTQNASDEIEINVSGYKSGIYFINVYDDKGNVATKKISVIK